MILPRTWQKLREQPDLLSTYLMREKVIDAVRLFFKQRKFHEVETPLLGKFPGTEPFLEPFETQLFFADGQTMPAFLVTNPEYSLKKLLAAGLPQIFQIAKCFRNGEGISGKHNSEFSLLEWYRTNASYTDIMKDCEELFAFLLNALAPEQNGQLLYQNMKYDVVTPWERLSVVEAFRKHAQIEEKTLLSPELLTVAQTKNYVVTAETTWEEVFNQIFLNEVEPLLGKNRPTILYDYPAALPSLAKKKASDPRFVERFEVYLAGMELGNAFSELTDPREQEKRLQEEEQLRSSLGKKTFGYDTDFIEALRTGLPPCAGIGMGLDRIIMLFSNAKTIEETLFFPVRELFDLG